MPKRPSTHKPAGWKPRPKPDNRPSASKRGYDLDWIKVRSKVLARNKQCACGAPSQVVDHIVPIRMGGARLDISNLRAMCKVCHNRKTATQDGGFGNARKFST